MNVVIFGLSITSSWGNGHATTYRSLVRGLACNGHHVKFFERDVPWYRDNRDDANPSGSETILYRDLEELKLLAASSVETADLVIVGSFVPDGIAVIRWVTEAARGVTAFYDIDTPVTLSKLEDGSCDYISPILIPRFDLYFSFTGGPTLRCIERAYGAQHARELYCSVDTSQYLPASLEHRWELGYLGTWSQDRQQSLEELLLEPARQQAGSRFAVVGPQYPDSIVWPSNVDRVTHLSPREHPEFYGSQRFTLNITREAMKRAGYSPSVRLFEAGACGAPIISDWWDGLDSILEPGREILITSDAEDTLRYLRDIPEVKRRQIGEAGRKRILAEHTPWRRAAQLEQYVREVVRQEVV